MTRDQRSADEDIRGHENVHLPEPRASRRGHWRCLAPASSAASTFGRACAVEVDGRAIHSYSPSPASDLAYQTRGIVEEERSREVLDPDVKVRAACGACNQTWMSAVESKAKRALLGVIRGETAPELDEATCRDIAAWRASRR